ncbi:hypothetical protein FKP32DRAFT_1670588 [Trametes sanguinea]|nr:hypothetical protein FKP32DRAFT_1670588 [Trametes sanguinea]
MNPPVHLQPALWLAQRDQVSLTHAQQQLPLLWDLMNRLFRDWQQTPQWDTRQLFGRVSQDGRVAIHINFLPVIDGSVQAGPEGLPTSILRMRTAQGPYNSSQFPYPNQVVAYRIRFDCIHWDQSHMAALPSLLHSFPALLNVSVLWFVNCRFTQQAVGFLHTTLQDRSNIHEMFFSDCEFVITPDFALHDSVRWATLARLELYQGRFQPIYPETQAELLRALSQLSTVGKPRLEELTYSVQDVADLWEGLGTTLRRFDRLKSILVWVREPILEATQFQAPPGTPQRRSNVIVVNTLELRLQLRPHSPRTGIYEIHQLAQDEQGLLQQASRQIAKVNKPGRPSFVIQQPPA